MLSSLKEISGLTGRLKKYPKIDAAFESVEYENMFFTGTATHSLDFRKSSGGFIHGFRYTSNYKKNKMSTVISIMLCYYLNS